MTRQAVTQTKSQTPTTSPLSKGGILQRKCADCGNHTVAGGECESCGKKKIGLQRKLTIGASNDPLELEADRVADQVMAAPASSTISHSSPRIQRFTGQASGQADMEAPASVESVLSSPGRPLDPELQQDMGQRFGHDFSQVRVHTGGEAERSAKDVNANAYTVGHRIVFGNGRFAPETYQGRRLVAHELTHVVQQSSTSPFADIMSMKRLLQRDDIDPLEEMAGVTNASVHSIVIDPGSGRTRFYTRGGKFINGQLVKKVASLGLGEYLLKKSETNDPMRTWDIFTADGKKYGAGLQFEVILDDVEEFSDITYTPSVKLRVESGVLPKLIDLKQRLEAIRKEVSKTLVNDAEELAIIKLLSDIPPEQAEAFVAQLRQEMIGDVPLLERLDRDIDGENNIALHQALSLLKLQAGGAKTAAALADAPTLAWHDVMGFFEQKAVFSVTRTDKGKIRIRYLGGITGGLYSSPDYAEIKSMSRKERLNIMTGEGIEVDAGQPFIVYDYDNDRQIVLTAEDLIAYQHAGVRKFLQDVGTIASLATPAGAETVGGRVLAYGIQIASIVTTIIDENKLNIRKWFPNWGPAIIDASEKVKIVLAVVGIAQLVQGGWKLFANLRKLRNARAAMDAKAVASTAEELALAEQQAARLEGQADNLLKQADLARKELGLADEVRSAEQLVPDAKATTGVGSAETKAQISASTPQKAGEFKVLEGITEETEKMLAQKPDVKSALLKNQRAAKWLKLCASLCIPQGATAEHIARLEHLAEEAEHYGIALNERRLKEFLHTQDSPEKMEKAIATLENELGKRTELSSSPKSGQVKQEFQEADPLNHNPKNDVTAPLSTEVLRTQPGIATGGEKLVEITGKWLKGESGALMPGQIARKMRNLKFKDFREFRETFWRLVAEDVNLSKNFDAEELSNMQKGFAPFAPTKEAIGKGRGNKVFQLDHIHDLQYGGGLYDLDNIRILSPRLNHGS
jgi:hypothetical protein